MVFLAAKSGLIKNAEEAARFQDFIICVEMLIAAIGHLYAFPYKEYAGANIGVSNGFMASLGHALKLNDFYHDTVHQVYSDLCVLYACDLPVMVAQVDSFSFSFCSLHQLTMNMSFITIARVKRA